MANGGESAANGARNGAKCRERPVKGRFEGTVLLNNLPPHHVGMKLRQPALRSEKEGERPALRRALDTLGGGIFVIVSKIFMFELCKINLEIDT